MDEQSHEDYADLDLPPPWWLREFWFTPIAAIGLVMIALTVLIWTGVKFR